MFKPNPKLIETLSLINDGFLDQLCSIYDKSPNNAKITGKLIFNSLLRRILLGRGVSLRSLELFINNSSELSSLIQSKNEDKKNITYSALSKDLNKRDPTLFQNIYEDLVEKYNNLFGSKQKEIFHRFDSTIMNLAGRTIKDGIKVGGGPNDTQIKISVGLKNQIPSSVRFCTEQKESSEDIALVRAINEGKVAKESVLLFDRGISKAETFQKFSQVGHRFVTRLNINRKIFVVSENKTNQPGVLRDCIVYLYNQRGKVIQIPLRLIIIKPIPTSKEKEIWIITNFTDLEPLDVAELYRRRWDIEVFFKFLKQHMNLKHFLNHTMNGMKIYIYMVFIAAILFIAYKTLMNLSGFKIPLLKFVLELEQYIYHELYALQTYYSTFQGHN